MASRSHTAGQAVNSEDIEQLLSDLEKRMDRTKVMFEQYFLGIQKMAPAHLHRDLERRVRDLTQVQIRNTALRFRFSTLSQRFGAYNTYWKRTLREIEQGSYLRDMARLGRDAARNGLDVPDEMLAKMPKLMRERILKDRQRVVDKANREQQEHDDAKAAGLAPTARPKNVHHFDEEDLLDDLDMDSIFSSLVGVLEAKPPAQPVIEAPALAPEQVVIPVQPPPLPMQGFRGQSSGSQAAIPVARSRPAPSATVPTPAPTMMAHAETRKTHRTLEPPVAPLVAKKPAAPVENPPPGMSVGQAQSFYQQYIKAKKLVGESTETLSYDRVMRSLNKQAPAILRDHKAKGVTFDVQVKDNKVVIKAKPKK